MTVWADADSLPRDAREIIARRAISEGRAAGGRAPGSSRAPGLSAVFVANREIGVRPGGGVSFELAGEEPGAADGIILAGVRRGDLVVTRDIPLAERLIAAHGDGVGVINDRGGRFSADSVGERRSLRDAMLELSLSGLVERKARTYGKREAGLFAKAFDAEIARLKRVAEVEDA